MPDSARNQSTSPKKDHLDTSMGLLQRAADKDPDAWERVVKLYYPLVLRWCRNSGLDEAEADCVAYDVLFKAVSRLKTFRKDEPGQMFRKWIRAITRNTLVDYARQRMPAPGGSGRFFNQIAFESMDSDDGAHTDREFLFRRALEIVRNHTNEARFQAFVEVVINGRRPADVAQELDMTPNMVYQTKCRILQKLKAEFSGFFG